MKPPRAYARGILHFFGAIRRSTLLAYSAEAAASAAKAGRSPSFGGSSLHIHPWIYVHDLLRRRIKNRTSVCRLLFLAIDWSIQAIENKNCRITGYGLTQKSEGVWHPATSLW
ncbi:MAG: hypothetical protein IH856_08305 [Deltaproteobacteria bacterium]|nr:hypothetical protein [Deltaproteobacteria bacterium]